MKKSKPRHSSSRRKAARTRARGTPAATPRRSVGLAGIAIGAVLIGAGALAYETWSDNGASAPRSRDAPRASTSDVLKDNLAVRTGNTSPAASADGGSQDSNHAQIQVSEESRDLGTMAVSEERSAEFFLRNVGGKPLEISQVRTSCMCTFTHVIIGGGMSPAFNMEMHNAPAVQSWEGSVEPGLTATVRVIYRPSLMPVEGSIARNVKFNTNDPSRPMVELGIHANVR